MSDSGVEDALSDFARRVNALVQVERWRMRQGEEVPPLVQHLLSEVDAAVERLALERLWEQSQDTEPTETKEQES